MCTRSFAGVYDNGAWHSLAQGLINSRDATINTIVRRALSASLIVLTPMPRRRKLVDLTILTAGTALQVAGFLYPTLSKFSALAYGWDNQYMISLADIASDSPKLTFNCVPR